MVKKEIVEQTRFAFEFIQKLYFEISYLIKELEGLLKEEEENFIIGKPSGYGITSRSSLGLETNNVSMWTLRNAAVFFVSEEHTQFRQGQTVTKLNQENKVIYLRIVLDEKRISEPYLLAGILNKFDKFSPENNWPTKFEQVMGHIEYRPEKVFNDLNSINYEDSYMRFSGKLFRVNLYDINSSEDIVNLIVNPALELYRNSA